MAQEATSSDHCLKRSRFNTLRKKRRDGYGEIAVKEEMLKTLSG
jgi:hypothetical protein